MYGLVLSQSRYTERLQARIHIVRSSTTFHAGLLLPYIVSLAVLGVGASARAARESTLPYAPHGVVRPLCVSREASHEHRNDWRIIRLNLLVVPSC